MNKLRRLMRLERARPSANGRARGVRTFLTTDGQTFLETTHSVFEPDEAILCPAGQWAWFVRARLVSREELERIADGWQVKVVEVRGG